MTAKSAKIYDPSIYFYLKGIWFLRSSWVGSNCFSKGTAALPPLPIFWGINSGQFFKYSISHSKGSLLRRRLRLKRSFDKFATTSSTYPQILTAGVRSFSKKKTFNPSSAFSDSFFTSSKTPESSKETTAPARSAAAMFTLPDPRKVTRKSGNDYSQEWLRLNRKLLEKYSIGKRQPL